MRRAFACQRKTERFQLQVPARIKPVQEVDVRSAIQLVTRDICSGGAYFETENPLPPGTEVEIEMILPLQKRKERGAKDAHVCVSGAVIRATETGMAVCFADDYVISPWQGRKDRFSTGRDAMQNSSFVA